MGRPCHPHWIRHVVAASLVPFLTSPPIMCLASPSSNSATLSEMTCDETKCRSPAFGLDEPNAREVVDCWALNNSLEPLDCEEGYIGVVVESVEPIVFRQKNQTYYYYTCCREEGINNHTTAIPAVVGLQRTCNPAHCQSPHAFVAGMTDCFVNSNLSEPMVCDPHQDYSTPREVLAFWYDVWWIQQFTCCLSSNDADAYADADHSEEFGQLSGGSLASNVSTFVDYNRCDETKCRSPAFGVDEPNTREVVDCWALNSFVEPLDCEEGYRGQIVESVEPIIHGADKETFYYYTCCPVEVTNSSSAFIEATSPTSTPSSSLERRCDSTYCDSPHAFVADMTDCFVNTNLSEPMVCDNQNFSTPREVFGFWYDVWWIQQFTCCQSSPTGVDKDGSNDFQGCSTRACTSPSAVVVDGVHDCIVSSALVGFYIEPMTCDTTSPYQYTRVVSNNPPLVTYICCDTDNGDHIYSHAPQMYWLLIPQLIVSAMVLTVVIIFVVGILTTKLLRRQVFSLYLVYMLVPDVGLNLAMVVALTKRLTVPTWVPDYDVFVSLLVVFSTSNLWFNTVIAHEVFRLLVRSHKRLRTPPPPTKQAAWQAIGVYALSIVLGGTLYACRQHAPEAYKIYVTFLRVVGAGIPVVYLSYITVRICKDGLLTSTRGKTKGIVLYFGRILLVFFFMALPGSILLGQGEKHMIIGLYFLTLQGAVSVLVARMNPDIQASTNLLSRLCAYCGCREGDQLSVSSMRGGFSFTSMRRGFSFFRRTNINSRLNIGPGLAIDDSDDDDADEEDPPVDSTDEVQDSNDDAELPRNESENEEMLDASEQASATDSNNAEPNELESESGDSIGEIDFDRLGLSRRDHPIQQDVNSNPRNRRASWLPKPSNNHSQLRNHQHRRASWFGGPSEELNQESEVNVDGWGLPFVPPPTSAGCSASPHSSQDNRPRRASWFGTSDELSQENDVNVDGWGLPYVPAPAPSPLPAGGRSPAPNSQRRSQRTRRASWFGGPSDELNQATEVNVDAWGLPNVPAPTASPRLCLPEDSSRHAPTERTARSSTVDDSLRDSTAGVNNPLEEAHERTNASS